MRLTRPTRPHNDMSKHEPEPSDEEASGGPRSLSRLLRLFDVMADSNGGTSLAVLAAALDSPKSSLLNLLRPLVADRYLLQDGGQYRLGPRAFRMASKILDRWSFPQLVQTELEQLAATTGETASLAVLDSEAARVTYVSVIDSRQPVRYALKVGLSAHLYCTAAGRVLLAHAESGWRERYLQTTTFKAYTPRTMVDADVLRGSLSRVLEDGFAVSIEESMPGGAALAAPIYGPDDRVVASLGVGAPADRLEAHLDSVRSAVMTAAARASGRG